MNTKKATETACKADYECIYFYRGKCIKGQATSGDMCSYFKHWNQKAGIIITGSEVKNEHIL